MDHELYSLGSLPGTYERQVTSHRLKDHDWEIRNTFPVQLDLYVQKAWTENVSFLSVIHPKQKIKLHPSALKEDDKLIVFYKGRPFTDEFTIRSFEKLITIGAIGYSSGPGAREFTASQSDIAGVRLINRCSVPLNFYYKGNPVAQVGSYVGQTYLGGGNDSVYFDNSRQGIDMWDPISISFSLKDELNWTTLILNDMMVDEIYLGIIQGTNIGPDPDTYTYNVTKPDWTGQTFYRPVGGYQTIMTNPFAPF
jgi:hypothetical protein